MLKSYPINPPIGVVMVAVFAVRRDTSPCIRLAYLYRISVRIVFPVVTFRIQADL